MNGPGLPSALDDMTWWKKLLGGGQDSEKVNYYEEGVALLRGGRFHEALTSLRLALKEAPGDTVVLQQIAISYTRIGMTEEASKTYQHVLQKDPAAAGRPLRAGVSASPARRSRGSCAASGIFPQ